MSGQCLAVLEGHNNSVGGALELPDERAKTAGMPERFAMENLGHNSKAVHRAYAKRALVKIPSLEKFEHQAAMRAE